MSKTAAAAGSAAAAPAPTLQSHKFVSNEQKNRPLMAGQLRLKKRERGGEKSGRKPFARPNTSQF